MSRKSAILPLIIGVVGFWSGLPSHYWFLWAALTSLGAAVGIIAGRITVPRKEMCLLPLGDGAYQLFPRQLPQERFWTVAILLFAATISGLALAASLIAHSPSLSLASLVFLGSVALLCIILVAHLIRGVYLAKNCQQPSLTLTTEKPELDHSFQLRLSIETPKPLHIDDCRAHIRCFEHALLHLGRFTHLVVRPHSQQIVEVAQAVDLFPAKAFSASASVLLDSASHLPTGKSRITMYPFYHWEIWVELSGECPSTTIFPLTISGPPPKDSY